MEPGAGCFSLVPGLVEYYGLDTCLVYLMTCLQMVFYEGLYAELFQKLSLGLVFSCGYDLYV